MTTVQITLPAPIVQGAQRADLLLPEEFPQEVMP